MTTSSTFSRRDFIKLIGAATAAGFLSPGWPVFGENGSLPIPPLLTGTDVNGVKVYDLTMQTGTTQLFNSGNATTTHGYNGSILGPTLKIHKGDDVQINVTNNLGSASTTHWHGLHLPAEMDGGPHQQIENGDTWSPTFTMLNRASTCWYHPHQHGTTGEQVYMGLAGLLLITDDESDALAIPQTYGTDDIPLVVQDRRFGPNSNSNEFFVNSPGLRKGDYMMVNGEIAPVFTAPQQMVRFRILNGSNARVYNFGLSDNRAFYQIASDGGLLASPVSMTRLMLAPGERAEIVVDFQNDGIGDSLTFMSYSQELADQDTSIFGTAFIDAVDRSNFDIMTIQVGSPTAVSTPILSLPATLTSITRYTADQAVNVDSPRTFVLGAGATINGVQMDMSRIDHVVELDTIEIWEISNTSGIGHPFHIHDDMFQILSRDGVDPPANEMGWKDTVFVNNGETVRVIRIFEHFADPDIPYMFHCHLLEHEDAGMMGQFTVEDNSDTGETGGGENETDEHPIYLPFVGKS